MVYGVTAASHTIGTVLQTLIASNLPHRYSLRIKPRAPLARGRSATLLAGAKPYGFGSRVAKQWLAKIRFLPRVKRQAIQR
jgi:hypothetical protein